MVRLLVLAALCWAGETADVCERIPGFGTTWSRSEYNKARSCIKRTMDDGKPMLKRRIASLRFDVSFDSIVTDGRYQLTSSFTNVNTKDVSNIQLDDLFIKQRVLTRLDLYFRPLVTITMDAKFQLCPWRRDGGCRTVSSSPTITGVSVDYRKPWIGADSSDRKFIFFNNEIKLNVDEKSISGWPLRKTAMIRHVKRAFDSFMSKLGVEFDDWLDKAVFPTAFFKMTGRLPGP